MHRFLLNFAKSCKKKIFFTVPFFNYKPLEAVIKCVFKRSYCCYCSVEYPVVPCLDSRQKHVLYDSMMAD